MPKIQIMLFAGVRDASGNSVAEIDFIGKSAGDLIEQLACDIPVSADLIRNSRLAVNGNFVGSDAILDDFSSELALIPPVSGG
ncbi:MAG: MoaD/ThiS family protein [Planctomycetota bacterium]